MKAKLCRFADNGDATLGTFILDGETACFTLEDTGTKNAPNVYRIPAGIYTLKRVVSPKFGQTFTVDGVAGHDCLRIHRGNSSDDTRGCILVGYRAGIFARFFIYESEAAFEALMTLLVAENEIPFSITDNY